LDVREINWGCVVWIIPAQENIVNECKEN
jgi:hypothetical protein